MPDATCPICRKPQVHASRPFCSRRCADVDLGRWLGGRYIMPTDEPADGIDDEDQNFPGNVSNLQN